MPTLQVLCRQQDLDPKRISNQIVVVLDILFATSTIVHALSEGVKSIWLALDRHEAKDMAATLGQTLCAGEYLTETLPGFAPAVPLALARHGLKDRALGLLHDQWDGARCGAHRQRRSYIRAHC